MDMNYLLFHWMEHCHEFTQNAKNGVIDRQELTIYYDMQCPFIYKNIEIIKEYCETNSVPVSLIRS